MQFFTYFIPRFSGLRKLKYINLKLYHSSFYDAFRFSQGVEGCPMFMESPKNHSPFVDEK